MDLQPSDEKVNISGLVKQDGKFHDGLKPESVSLVLTRVQEETAHPANHTYVEKGNRTYRSTKPIYLNLFVLTVFNFSIYQESLKFLSATLQFFQSQPSFSLDSAVSFDISGVEKIQVKLVSQTQEQQNHLWGTLGAKYMPSILYKVSLLQIQNEQVVQEVPPIASIDYSMTRKM